MTKLLLTMAAGSAFLLVSCEPIPFYPEHQHPRPHTPGEQEQPKPDRPDGDEEEIVRPPTQDEHPVAQRTANPNHVISPFSPFNVINVEGFRSGQLAKDPSNGKIFRIP
jgi:hypothetical protein